MRRPAKWGQASREQHEEANQRRSAKRGELGPVEARQMGKVGSKEQAKKVC